MVTQALLASDLAGGYRQGRGGEDGCGILGRVRHAYKLPKHPWWANKVPPEAQADSKKENKPLPQRLLVQSGLQTQTNEGRASAEIRREISHTSSRGV